MVIDSIVTILLALLSFLSGSVMYCLIIPKILLNKDVTENSDDHNPGAANVFIQCGVPMGMLCLVFELLKGFVPVFVSCYISNTNSLLFALVIAAPVLGHATAPFNRYRGGKCIAVSFGVLLGLLPLSYVCFVLAGIFIFFSVVITIHPNSLRSIFTFAVFGLISSYILFSNGESPIAFGCIIISLTAMIKITKSYKKYAV